MLAGAVTLLALLVAGALWRGSRSAEQTAYYFAPLAMPARDLALGPDGRTAAVIGYSESSRKNVIWIYEVGSQTARTLPNTEGADYPFWSPDGKWVGFFSDGQLKKIELAGGQVRTICDAPSGRGGTWNRNDVIVFSPNSRQVVLYQVQAS